MWDDSGAGTTLRRKALDTLVESQRTVVTALDWAPAAPPELRLRRVRDVGANTGAYARVARETDPLAQRLLLHRSDIFPKWTQAGFEPAFGQRFDTLASGPVDEIERVRYLKRRKPPEAC